MGGWLTYGGSVADDTTVDCIHAAIESGVNFIDLADVYANGEAERVVGRTLKDYRRSSLVISSKLFWPVGEGPNDRGLSRKHIMESVEGSLQRLGTDYLDLYFAHRHDPETPIEEVVRAMDDLVHQGKILYWGTSVWSATQIAQAVGTARQLMAYPPQVEQPRYNMLDRHIEPDVVPTVDQYGIGLTIFSPLAQGLLTGKYNHGIPTGSRADTSHWLDRELDETNIARVQKLSELAAQIDLSMSQMALAWILRLPQVSSVITGATHPDHVRTNVKAAGVTLTPDVLDEIERILNNAPGQ